MFIGTIISTILNGFVPMLLELLFNLFFGGGTAT